MFKNNKNAYLYKLAIFAICTIIGIALIVVGAVFISQYPPLNQLTKDIRFWHLFGFIITLLVGIGLFTIGSLTIIDFIYMKKVNKELNKQKENIKHE